MCAKKKNNKSSSTTTINTSTQVTGTETVKNNLQNDLSNIPPEQITKLRDAFDVIDHDTDGVISSKDLEQLKQIAAKELSEQEIKTLLSLHQEDMNFSNFLSLISNDLSMVPNKSEILRALQVFSKDTEINSKELSENLSSIGMKESDYQPVLDKFKSESMNGETLFMGTNFLNFVAN